MLRPEFPEEPHGTGLHDHGVPEACELCSHFAHIERQYAKLADREANLLSLIENTSELICSIDRRYRLTMMNSNFGNALNHVLGETVSPGFNLHPHISDNPRLTWLKEIDKAFAGESFTAEHLVSWEGEEAYYSVTYHPIRELGQVVGVTCFSQNITRRRLMERSLIAAKEEAEEANRAKTQFMSRMSHELRTPLHAILGFAQLLELEDDPPLTEGQLDQVEEILKAGQHLLELITDILDISRMEIGKLPLSREQVDLGGIVAECVASLQPMANKNGVRLLSPKDLPPVQIQMERVRLKQILLNLLSNAVKYNVVGGTVAVLAEVRGQFVQIKVRDTGLGIAQEHLPEVFEPFTRFHTQYGIEGSGFGLTITKQLVELMGGRIDVTSKEREGTTFIVDLPM